MEIGLFQLENLFANPNRFSFFDLRAKAEPVRVEIDRLLQKAERVSASKLAELCRQKKVEKNFPIVLVCEDGRTSSAAAHELESVGYLQVYVVTLGVAGLLSEL